MVDTDDTQHTTADEHRTMPQVWHKLPSGELKIHKKSTNQEGCTIIESGKETHKKHKLC